MYFVNLNIQLKRITNPRLMLLIKKKSSVNAEIQEQSSFKAESSHGS